MIRVMILEDDFQSAEILKNYIIRFSKENNKLFEINSYNNSNDFINNFNENYDILLMDIEMNGINGMEAAKIIRKKNKNVIIVFVTNLAQYAIEGYEVEAYDFILKPVRYVSFCMKLNRICTELEHKNEKAIININYKGNLINLFVCDILYIEIQNHDAIIHTYKENIKVRATLQSFIERLSNKHFELCNSCYLINLKYITKIEKDTLYINNNIIPISRPKRKHFLQEVSKYFGGSI